MLSSENKFNTAHMKRGFCQGSVLTSLAFILFRKNSHYIFPISILVSLGIAYGSTLAPGLTWANGGADGGDLITAAAIHGVAHPSGYPLYLALAWIFQQIPLGSLAFRTNLMSAICMVLAAIVVYHTARYLLVRKPYGNLAGWGAAITFGISPLVWSQAVITEVYALQTLLTACIIYQALTKDETWGSDFLRGFIVGLALGNHLTTLFLVPLLFIDDGSICFRYPRSLHHRLLSLLLGSLIYLLLPLWAHGQPPVNWGNPITLKAFYSLVSGEIYQSYFSLILVVARLRGWAGLLIEQVGLVGLAIGFFYLLRSRKITKKAAPLFWVFIIYGAFALVYGSYDSYIYLIPTVLAFSLWIGGGIQEMIQLAASHWRSGWVVASLLLLSILIYQAVSTVPKVDASHDLRAERFGKTVMMTLPNNALIFTKDDETTFTLWYFQYGLKQRADIAVIVEGLLKYEWYISTLRKTYPEVKIPWNGKITIESIAAANPSRKNCTFEDHYSTSAVCSMLIKD